MLWTDLVKILRPVPQSVFICTCIMYTVQYLPFYAMVPQQLQPAKILYSTTTTYINIRFSFIYIYTYMYYNYNNIFCIYRSSPSSWLFCFIKIHDKKNTTCHLLLLKFFIPSLRFSTLYNKPALWEFFFFFVSTYTNIDNRYT